MTHTLSSTYSSQVTLLDTVADNPTTVTPTGLLEAGLYAAPASSVGGAAWTITNAGRIWGGAGDGIQLASAGVVVNAGSIAASGDGVALLAGGMVTNEAAGSITTALGAGVDIGGSAGTVVNYGSIAGAGESRDIGIGLASGGLVTNAVSASITGLGFGIRISGGAGTVVNDGNIAGLVITPVGNIGYGVDLLGGGLVTNAATGTISSLGDIGVYITGGVGTVLNAGTIVSAAGGGHRAVFLQAGGDVTNAQTGTINSNGVYGIQISGGAGTVSNAGTISGGSYAIRFSSGPTNRLVIDPGAVFAGTVDGGNTIGSTIVSTIELASAASAGTVTGFGTQFLNFGSVEFDAGADWFISGNTSGLASGQTISGFAPGDTIELTNITVTGSSYVGGVLTLMEQSGSVQLDLPGSFATADFMVTPAAGGEDISVTCFCAGTRVQTERGEVPVEKLHVGETVLVHVGDGGIMSQPVIWIGHRSVDCMHHSKPKNVWPVRIRTWAFGPRGPARDLFLSPDHAVFIDDVLIPVKYLINGLSIHQVSVASVEYFHVELPAHAVLLAEGLPVESYLDVGDRANFANGGEPVTLFPDFATRAWEARGCAQLVVTGAQLQAARALVDSFAVAVAA